MGFSSFQKIPKLSRTWVITSPRKHSTTPKKHSLLRYGKWRLIGSQGQNPDTKRWILQCIHFSGRCILLWILNFTKKSNCSQICSMYRIFTYTWLRFMVNAGTSSLHEHLGLIYSQPPKSSFSHPKKTSAQFIIQRAISSSRSILAIPVDHEIQLPPSFYLSPPSPYSYL